MSTTVLTGIGIDTNILFPGLRGGAFTVLSTDPGVFRIQYDLDGNPGEGLIVEFVSLANDFTYAGSAPTGGTFTDVDLYADDGVTRLAEFRGVVTQDPSDFNSATLASELIGANFRTHTGNSGDDILRNFGGTDGRDATFIGNGGDDTFVVTALAFSGSFFRGSAADGTGGAGEFNTIVNATDATLVLRNGRVADIDALTFDGTGNSGFQVQFAPSSGSLSDTAVITGDSHANTIQFTSFGSSIDLSGLTFNTWTSGDDRVSISANNTTSTQIGSVVDDSFFNIGSGSTAIGLDGDDIFRISQLDSGVTIHGSAADGTGGTSETDLLQVQFLLDFRTLNATLTNIDGFSLISNGFLSINGNDGTVTSRGRAVQIDASDFGTLLPTDLVVTSPNGVRAAFEVFLDTVGGVFDASGWQPSNLQSGSQLHVTDSAGADTITGWNHDTIVVSQAGDDIITTGDGNDRIFVSGSGSRTISTGDGVDQVNVSGGTGNTNTIMAGDGNDRITLDAANVGGLVDGGAGDQDNLTLDLSSTSTPLNFALLDPTQTTVGPNGISITGIEQITISAGTGDDDLTGGVGRAQLYGNDGADTLTAGAGSSGNILSGGAGADTLNDSGTIGNSLNGGDDDDQLISQLGATFTFIDGGDGTDVAIIDRANVGSSLALDVEAMALGTQQNLSDGTRVRNIEQIDFSAGSGNDDISGGALDDIIRGNAGRDDISGRAGDDQLFGGDGLDTIDGGAGEDVIDGGGGIDFIDGGDDNDTLRGGAGPDTIDGGAGDDFVEGGSGADTLDGSDGTDTATYENSLAGVFINLEAATAAGGDASGDSLTNFENLIGSAFADALTGDAENNILDGGAGADALSGGAGDDIFILDDAGDRIGENEGEGTDLALTEVSYIFDPNVENATLTGTADNDLQGNDLDNMLTGNDGANGLAGGAGDDTIIGGGGNDQIDGQTGADDMQGGMGEDFYNVDNTGDTVIEDFNSGEFDAIRTSIDFTLVDNTEILILQGVGGAIDGTGNDGPGNDVQNLMLGNFAANTLTTFGGNDVILGRAGDDIINSGTSTSFDMIVGGRGADTLTGDLGHDFFKFLDVTEAGDTITDFTVSSASNNDILDLRDFSFTGFTGATSADAIMSGHLRVLRGTTDTEVFVDVDGGNDNFVLLATLENTTAAQIEDFILV